LGRAGSFVSLPLPRVPVHRDGSMSHREAVFRIGDAHAHVHTRTHMHPHARALTHTHTKTHTLPSPAPLLGYLACGGGVGPSRARRAVPCSKEARSLPGHWSGLRRPSGGDGGRTDWNVGVRSVCGHPKCADSRIGKRLLIYSCQHAMCALASLVWSWHGIVPGVCRRAHSLLPFFTASMRGARSCAILVWPCVARRPWRIIPGVP
jgi:hypothetical protein